MRGRDILARPSKDVVFAKVFNLKTPWRGSQDLLTRHQLHTVGNAKNWKPYVYQPEAHALSKSFSVLHQAIVEAVTNQHQPDKVAMVNLIVSRSLQRQSMRV